MQGKRNPNITPHVMWRALHDVFQQHGETNKQPHKIGHTSKIVWVATLASRYKCCVGITCMSSANRGGSHIHTRSSGSGVMMDTMHSIETIKSFLFQKNEETRIRLLNNGYNVMYEVSSKLHRTINTTILPCLFRILRCVCWCPWFRIFY